MSYKFYIYCKKKDIIYLNSAILIIMEHIIIGSLNSNVQKIKNCKNL